LWSLSERGAFLSTIDTICEEYFEKYREKKDVEKERNKERKIRRRKLKMYTAFVNCDLHKNLNETKFTPGCKSSCSE
jgi:hypothetical protein